MLKNMLDAAFWMAVQKWISGAVDTGTRPRRVTNVRQSRVHRGRWMGSLKVSRIQDLSK